MNAQILAQLAQTTLLSTDVSATIIAGETPPMEELVKQLVVAAWDCQAMIEGDNASNWNDKRLARLLLCIAFLTSLHAPSKG